LTALPTVRRERLFIGPLGYNLLWLGFLHRGFSEGSFNQRVFAQNCQNLLSTEVARRFFAEVYELSRQGGRTSDKRLTAGGTLSESRAA